MKNTQKAYVYALLAILSWSTVATAFKIGLRYLDFIQFIFVGAVFAFCFYSAVILFTGKFSELKKYTPKQYFQSAALGFLNPFAYYIVLLKAYSLLPAQVAQPLNYTWPIMLVLLSVPLLGQKISLKSFIAIIVSFLGVFMISTQGNISEYEIQNPTGVLLAVSSSIIWALFWLLNVKDKRDEATKLFLNFGFGIIYIFIAMLFFSNFDLWRTEALLSGAYIGAFELGIPFILWLLAIKKTDDTAKISNLVFISPFLALIFINIILKEQIHATTVIGLLLIITGIVIQQLKRRKLSTKKQKV